jgi:hypothetical protein
MAGQMQIAWMHNHDRRPDDRGWQITEFTQQFWAWFVGAIFRDQLGATIAASAVATAIGHDQPIGLGGDVGEGEYARNWCHNTHSLRILYGFALTMVLCIAAGSTGKRLRINGPGNVINGWLFLGMIAVCVGLAVVIEFVPRIRRFIYAEQEPNLDGWEEKMHERDLLGAASQPPA